MLAIHWPFDNYPLLFFSFLCMFGAGGGVNIRWVGLRFPPRVYAVPGELLVKIAPRAGPGQGYEGHKSSLLQLLTIPPSSPAHFGTTNNQPHITLARLFFLCNQCTLLDDPMEKKKLI